MSTVPYALPRDLRCSACGYGIVARRRLPERCPMCGGSGWAAQSVLPLVPRLLGDARRPARGAAP